LQLWRAEAVQRRHPQHAGPHRKSKPALYQRQRIVTENLPTPACKQGQPVALAAGKAFQLITLGHQLGRDARLLGTQFQQQFQQIGNQGRVR